MLTKEENEMLTRVGPGTPMGELLRRYWQPAALSEELPPGGPPLPIRLLGEDLVLFRDEQGRPGLLGIHCSHRGADLSYGRLEDGGLRCIYHGWLYDVRGRCLEQPGEPAGQAGLASKGGSASDDPLLAAGPARFHERISHKAYPCHEAGGVILTYMGPGEPPLVPSYEFLNASEESRATSKYFQDCNFLQGNEGNLDPVHLSFLHRMSRPDEQSRQLWGRLITPTISAEMTDYGTRIYSVRRLDDEKSYVRITNFVMPNLCAIPTGEGGGFNTNWHVPIDDEHSWRYSLFFTRTIPAATNRQMQPNRADLLPGYRLARNKANRYLQDREEMNAQKTFVGLGSNFVLHDTCATEGAGPIQDRTQEHPGTTDVGIFAARKVLFQGIKDVMEGRDPPHVIRDPAQNYFPHIFVRDEMIPTSTDLRTYWVEDVERAAAAMALGRPETASRVALSR